MTRIGHQCPLCNVGTVKCVNVAYRDKGRVRLNVYHCNKCQKYIQEDKLSLLENIYASTFAPSPRYITV